uniref:Uncharacterized protein n=1 Tax=viral metagenome TaxID=1070528 RepID=A0A6C0EQE6_9ZZZZ
MASNIQRGTRGLSAGDITRLKRLTGARNNLYYVYDRPSPPRVIRDKDITNPAPRLEPESGRRVYTEIGGSKIRRPASGYTDFIAAQTADFVVETLAGSCGVSRDLRAYKICTCFYGVSAVKHNGLCRSCTHDRIVVKPSEPTLLPIIPGTITLDMEFCSRFGGPIIIGIPGRYTIDNQLFGTSFIFNGSPFTIPQGLSIVTFPISGLLTCDNRPPRL